MSLIFQTPGGSAQFLSGAMLSDEVISAAIAGSVDNFEPDGWAGATVCRVRASAAWTITGLKAPPGGAPAFKYICNDSGFTGTLANASGSSNQENRLNTGGVNLSLAAGLMACLLYNPRTQLYDLVGVSINPASIAGTPGGSDKQVQFNNAGAFGGISNGTSGQVLTSNGASVTPSMQSLAGTAPISVSGLTITTSMATGKLIGRSTAGSGVMEEITVGSGLSLAGGILSTTGGAGTTFYSASLAADDVVTTVTLADKLSVTALPAGNYAFEAWLRCTQTSGAGDIKFAIRSSVATLSNNFGCLLAADDTAAVIHIPAPFTSGGATPASANFDFTGGSQVFVCLSGSMEFGAAADVSLQWAQVTAAGALTISRGAWMRMMKVS